MRSAKAKAWAFPAAPVRETGGGIFLREVFRGRCVSRRGPAILLEWIADFFPVFASPCSCLSGYTPSFSFPGGQLSCPNGAHRCCVLRWNLRQHLRRRRLRIPLLLPRCRAHGWSRPQGRAGRRCRERTAAGYQGLGTVPRRPQLPWASRLPRVRHKPRVTGGAVRPCANIGWPWRGRRPAFASIPPRRECEDGRERSA